MTAWTDPLEAFCKRSKSKAPVAPSGGKYRHAAEALAVVAWYRVVRSWLPETISETAIQQHMDRVLFGIEPARDGDSNTRRNRWRSYRDGQHMPERELIEAVEEQFPGSESVLDHSLWHVLDPRNSANRLHRLWRGGLDTVGQDILRDADARGDAVALNAKEQLKLLTLDPLDSVAACGLLVRLALERQQQAQAFVHAATLSRALLIHWTQLEAYGIAEPLAIYLDLFLMARALGGESVRWTVEGIDFPREAELLSRLASEAAAECGAGRPVEIRQVKALLLTGAYGMVHLHAFSAYLRAHDGASDVSLRAAEGMETHRQRKAKALLLLGMQ